MLNGAEIRRRRESLGLTQVEASAKCGWQRPSLWSDVELGLRKHITAETLHAIARALNCSMDDLMTDRPAPHGRGGNKTRKRRRT